MFARLAGAVLDAVFAGILLVRRPRPIHPHGLLLHGELSWLPGAVRSGMPWIDEAPGSPLGVTARLSRSVGLPSALPDIIGLALRVDVDGRPVDIEFATTGIGVPSRFLLVPHRRPGSGTYGVLMPYRSARGPVLLAARSVPERTLPADPGAWDAALRAAPWRLRLYHATLAGRWHPFADLVLASAGGDDTAMRFDAVRNPFPGDATYRWTAALREPSYRRARRAGGGS